MRRKRKECKKWEKTERGGIRERAAEKSRRKNIKKCNKREK